MAYDSKLAGRIREYLSAFPTLKIEERKMFGGHAFLVNGKMCINVSHDNLMCRFDAALQTEVSEKKGFQPMIMKTRELKGYCYVSPEGYKKKNDFEYWVNQCLSFNAKAKASRKTKPINDTSKE